ncbi:unnamed protein product [Cyprideis torosa]|uniref:Uncharacterized protein n=1 Tax=Cyprideis torosa TaxID=163714 RepID=A0A7R8ZSR5_9CRUS|nr:unnamed protein product [Cyprideis torosa]CAG0906376.1 unnamed protein product [Cyprideis torosa]
MGSFMGQFANVPVTHLGAAAIKGALVRANFDGHRIDEVFMGHVLQAGAKQAPARNAALLAGVSDQTPCTTVNKVCSSGLKAVMFAAQAIQCDDAQVVVAGGMESMSMTPHYLRARAGAKFGNLNLLDGIMEDGLTDAQDGSIMGSCAELCAKEHDFDRKAQDDYARSSYQRAAKAWDNGLFKDEIIAVDVPQGKGNSLSIIEDEEYKRVNFDKMSELRPSFQKDGTVTAANASTLNDGASALLIMNREQSDAAQLKPLARILSYADAARDAARFTIAPSLAIPKALDKAGLKIEDIDSESMKIHIRQGKG